MVEEIQMLKVKRWSRLASIAFSLLFIAIMCFTLLPSPIPFGGAGVASADGESWYNSNWPYRISKLITAADSSISDFTVTGGITPLKLHTGNATQEFAASKDTRIRETAPTTNYGNGTFFAVGEQSTNIQRALLDFDLTSVPEGITITSAALQLYYYQWVGSDTGNRTMTIYRNRRTDWIEAKATWDIYKTGGNWTTAGAGNTTDDIDTSLTASTDVPASHGWMTWTITNLVTDAIANRSDLLSMRLHDAEAAGIYHTYWYSKEYTGNTSRCPKLVIEYRNNDGDLYFNEKCKNYFDDIRVTEPDGVTEITYYLRNVTSSQADLCIQTDVSTSSKTVYVYYGNPSASRVSDLNATFIGGEWEREGAGNILSYLYGNYTAHSGLCRLHDGTLLSTFSRGEGHVSKDSKLYYSKSTDQGRTWGTATEFYDHASYAPNGVVPAEILIGGVYHIIVSLQVVNNDSVYDTNRKAYIIVSVDSGTTWGANSPDYDDGNLILVGGTGADDDARGIRSRVIEYTQSGTQKLGLATYNHAGSGGTINGRIYFNWCPTSDLTDWTEVFVSDEGDGENGAYEFAEPVVVQTKDGGVFDGDFYMSTLSSSSPYNIRRIISTDYGATWGNNTPTYDDGLTDVSGLTQDSQDSIDIIRLSTGSLVCSYMRYASDDDGELRLVKPSAEDVDITWDTTNYSEPWRYRLTVGRADYGYPSMAEITDGGQIGVSFYMIGLSTSTALQFHYVPLGSFVGNRFSHTSTMKISCIGGGTWTDYVRIAEGTTESAIAQKYINPAVTKFWIEYKMYSTSQDTNDQQYFMGTDGTPVTDRLVAIIMPLNTDQNDIYYRSAATNIALTANDYVEGATYRFRILVNEADSLISYYLYDDTYTLLYSAVNKAYAAGSPTDLDYLQLGSSTSAGQALSNWYGIQLRKYAATEPTWSTTGSEEEFSVDISNTPTSWSVGIVQPSSVHWANGAEPDPWPLEDADCWGNITNNSYFLVDISASMTDMTGGTTWSIGASPDTNIFTLKIGILGTANIGNFTTLSNAPVTWIANMAVGNMTRWTMVFYTPTNTPQFADGTPKSGNMTFEAEAS
jgi:hypothetical protein